MKNKKIFKFMVLYFPIMILFLGIGYASVSKELTVDGIAKLERQKEIAITSVTPTNLVENYNDTILTTNLELDNSSDVKTLSVTIENAGSSSHLFDGIIYDDTRVDLYSNSNIVPSLSGITPLSTIVNSAGKNGSSITFNVSFSYDDTSNITDNSLEGTINFHFTPLRQVTYDNCTNLTDQTSETIRAKSFTDMNGITHSSTVTIKDSPSFIVITTASGLELDEGVDYTYQNGVVTFIKELRENITIGTYTYGYFMSYDGEVNLFGFDKANLTEFRRDNTKTLLEVLDMYDNGNGTAQKISNESNDAYNSDYDIYAWVENNKFYWWSEADIVYFHPNTTNAFKNNRDSSFNNNDRKFDKLKVVDLTDTSTSKVKNFSHWFDSDIALTTIIGRINTNGLVKPVNDTFNYRSVTNNGESSHNGFAFMFNDCNALTGIDLSGFKTENAVDMKRMFAGCLKVPSFDVSNFDTSSVKSMHWMFRKVYTATEINLENFDTSNVVNMFGMFAQSTGPEIISFGSNFDTSGVKYFTNMFYGNTNLRTIYAKIDFKFANDATGSSMFYGADNLIGAEGKIYYFATVDTNDRGLTYARIGRSEEVKGFFTLRDEIPKYDITYELNGGTAVNASMYYANTETFAITNPTKPGYTFIGWTGTDLDGLTMYLEITAGSVGNKFFEAHYEPNPYYVSFNANGGVGSMDNQALHFGVLENLSENEFTRDGYTFAGWNTKADGTGDVYTDEESVVDLVDDGTLPLYATWRLNGTTDPNFSNVYSLATCTFNGPYIDMTNCGNNTGRYINTGVTLYDATNVGKDFEISFDISNYDPNEQINVSGNTQQTIVNIKNENKSLGYPGIVFRRAATNLTLKADMNDKTNNVDIYYPNLTSVKIVRKNNVVLYSYNGAPLAPLLYYDNNVQKFSTPVTLGASLNSSNTPFRHAKVTLSNVYIKLGKYSQ